MFNGITSLINGSNTRIMNGKLFQPSTLKKLKKMSAAFEQADTVLSGDTIGVGDAAFDQDEHRFFESIMGESGN